MVGVSFCAVKPHLQWLVVGWAAQVRLPPWLSQLSLGVATTAYDLGQGCMWGGIAPGHDVTRIPL